MNYTRRQFLQISGLSVAALALPLDALAQRARVDTRPLIVDGHLDLGYNILNLGRDFTQSALTLRAKPDGGGLAMVGLPEMLAGRVALCVGVIFVYPEDQLRPELRPYFPARYDTTDEAEKWGWASVEAMEGLAEGCDQFCLVATQVDLDAVLASWEPDQPPEGRQVGIILGMEGADPIRDPAALAEWYARGLRNVGPAWSKTRYSGSSRDGDGLTDLGVELLAEMARLGMLLDVAHMSVAAFWQALEVWTGPVVYSHGVLRRYLPGERSLDDYQVRGLAERDGLVALSTYNEFYARNRAGEGVSLEDVVNAIDAVCQLLGDCDHVAIGSDADGGFGAEAAPEGMDTIADLQKIPAALAARGYDEAAVDAIAHGNWLRIWRQVLP